MFTSCFPLLKTYVPTTAILIGITLLFVGCRGEKNQAAAPTPSVTLTPAKKFNFNSFVDCNMAEAWVGDTFRIFPGMYGEDPLWGYSNELKFADGRTADEAFGRPQAEFTQPGMPANALPGRPGLHGAVWFETVYQDRQDPIGKTLYAVYHNENYPATLPYDSLTGEGYKNILWPQGLKGPSTATAVCRIGIMRSTNGGHSWQNRGIFIEDKQARLILRPDNTAINFAGGTGDPSAVASNGFLYLFYGEYGYPGKYDHNSYNAEVEHNGQCISVARIALSELDNPAGKARRWDGTGFNAPFDSVGKPVAALVIPTAQGGGAASSPTAKYYWGPSVSWNSYLNAWVMLMAKAEGPSWKGNSIYVSFNTNKDLGVGNNSQQWSAPQLLVKKPGHVLWYPSLQPLATPGDVAAKNTCLRLGQKARLFYKDNQPDTSEYLSEYLVDFKR